MIDRKHVGERVGGAFGPIPWVGTETEWVRNGREYPVPIVKEKGGELADGVTTQVEVVIGLMIRSWGEERDLIRFTFDEWRNLSAQVEKMLAEAGSS